MKLRNGSRRILTFAAVSLCASISGVATGQQPRPITIEAAESPVDVIDAAVSRLKALEADRPLVPAEVEAVLAPPQPVGTKPLLRSATRENGEPPLRSATVVAAGDAHGTTARPALQPVAVAAAPNWQEPSLLGRLAPATVSPADEIADPAIVRLPPVNAETVSAQTTPTLPSRSEHKHPAAVIRLLPTAPLPQQQPDFIAAIPNRPPLLARIQPQADPLPPSPAAPVPEDALPPPERVPLLPAEVLPVPGMEDPAVRVQVYPEDKPIGSLTLNIAPRAGVLPKNMAAGRFDIEVPSWELRPWEETVYFWDAPAFCHRPLYYEEKNLERLGYTHFPHLQPVVSAAHFTICTLGLPYSMTVNPPHECMYPLGHYRPGSPVPFQHNWPEWDPAAAAVQTGVVAGLILLIP